MKRRSSALFKGSAATAVARGGGGQKLINTSHINMPFLVHVHVVEAITLSKEGEKYIEIKIADENGKTAKQLQNGTLRTQSIKAASNPIFNEYFTLGFLSLSTYLQLKIYNLDIIHSDQLGEVMIKLDDFTNDAGNNNKQYVYEQWFHLSSKKHSKIYSSGSIFLRVFLERNMNAYAVVSSPKSPLKGQTSSSRITRAISSNKVTLASIEENGKDTETIEETKEEEDNDDTNTINLIKKHQQEEEERRKRRRNKIDISLLKNDTIVGKQHVQQLNTITWDGRPNTSSQISIFIASWNVGNEPPPEDLSSWLPTKGYDIFAIGTQECSYEISGDLSGKQEYHSCGSEWLAVLRVHFGNEYRVITSVSLREIRLVCFIKRNLQHHISGVVSGSKATGIGNVVGNKGGVGIAFCYDHTSFAFVNCHLAAHMDKNDARNNDIKMILHDLYLQGNSNINYELDECYDFIYLFGDLNYRLDYGEPDEQLWRTPSAETFQNMLADIEKKRYIELMCRCDQLHKSMEKNEILFGFEEGIYNFPPTFKLMRHLHAYNLQRLPSYCDRVLWRVAPGLKTSLIQTHLTSSPLISTSDHYPISCGFRCNTWIQHSVIDDDLPEVCLLSITSLKGYDLKDKNNDDIIDNQNNNENNNNKFKFSSPSKKKKIVEVSTIIKLSSSLISGVGSINTDPVSENCNPHFGRSLEKLQNIPLLCNSPSRFYHEYIEVECIHVTSQQTKTSKIRLGVGRIPLSLATDAYEEYIQHKNYNKNEKIEIMFAFSIDLVHSSCRAGTIKGKVKLEWMSKCDASGRKSLDNLNTEDLILVLPTGHQEFEDNVYRVYDSINEDNKHNVIVNRHSTIHLNNAIRQHKTPKVIDMNNQKEKKNENNPDINDDIRILQMHCNPGQKLIHIDDSFYDENDEKEVIQMNSEKEDCMVS